MSKTLTVPAAQQVISVKEAHNLLGQKSKTLTNEELETLIKETKTVVTSRGISQINWLETASLTRCEHLRELLVIEPGFASFLSKKPPI